MIRGLTVAVMTFTMFGFVSDAFAKKARPPATLPATQPTTNKSDLETGKARATEFEKGKTLDPGKTGSKIDTLTGQVGSLEQKLRTGTTTPPPATGDASTTRRRPRTTQPTTQPAATVDKARTGK